MATWFREPLIWFLLAGAAVFLLERTTAGAEQIILTDTEIGRIQDQWQAQMGRPPTDKEMAGLLAQWQREEVYYREAKRMGLDDNDTIVRRRLVQKLTFLTEDIATAEPPTEDELQSYYNANPERYTEPTRFTFTHRYFSNDRREDAQTDAAAALETLPPADRATRTADVPGGDPFLLQRDYAERSARQISDLFGAQFAQAMPTLPVGTWSGPVQSAYGSHLVYVIERIPSHLQPYEDVATKVASDFKLEQRQKANDAYYEQLVDRYEIVEP